MLTSDTRNKIGFDVPQSPLQKLPYLSTLIFASKRDGSIIIRESFSTTVSMVTTGGIFSLGWFRKDVLFESFNPKAYLQFIYPLGFFLVIFSVFIFIFQLFSFVIQIDPFKKEIIYYSSVIKFLLRSEGKKYSWDQITALQLCPWPQSSKKNVNIMEVNLVLLSNDETERIPFLVVQKTSDRYKDIDNIARVIGKPLIDQTNSQ